MGEGYRWDAAPLYDNGKLRYICLTTNPAKETKDQIWWAAHNKYALYEEGELIKYYGIVGTGNHNAGCYFKDDKYYFYYGANAFTNRAKALKEEGLAPHQTSHYAISDDGIEWDWNYRSKWQAPKKYNHKGKYAWRDPFIVKYDGFYMFMVTGGHRWFKNPQIYVARAEALDDTWQELGPVLAEDTLALYDEIEMPYVTYVEPYWYLAFSSWNRFNRIKASDYVWHICRSKNITGPYTFHRFEDIGLYGVQIAGPYITGWRWVAKSTRDIFVRQVDFKWH
jgi:hypothetical protein